MNAHVSYDEDPEGVPTHGMDDEETPTQMLRGFGVRRVNNLPVFIAGGLLLGFVSVIAVVAANKAARNGPKPRTAESVADKSNSTQAFQMAGTIAQKAPTGIVAPLAPPSLSPLGEPMDAVGILSPPLDPRAASYTAAAASEEAALQQERTRILVLKRTQLEEAIRAPTSIASASRMFGDRSGFMDTGSAAGGAGGVSELPPAGATGATGSGLSEAMLGQLNEARSQIVSVRQQALASARAISKKLTELTEGRGEASASESSSPGTAPSMGDGTAGGDAALRATGSESMPPLASIPTAFGSAGASSSGANPGLLKDAVAQFEGKDRDQDRWALNSNMSVPRSPYELRAGAVIPAILISGVNSELPGQIIAQLSENVYDTARGYSLLLPQGSRLIGEYTSRVGYGQSRIMVVWKRIVFPDAKALDIGAMPGTDGAGYAGMKDQVNNHYIRLFAGAAMLSAIEAAVVKSQPQSEISLYPSTSQALDQSLGQQLGLTATQLIQKNMNIAPTLNIRPGYRLNVMVTKDMIFSKPYQSFDY